MAYVLSAKSKAKLKGVHPDLVKVIELAIKKTTQDFSVGEGVRTPARQKELYAQGRTRPGPIVTWTLNSNHFAHKDGYGHAVDLITYPVDYSNTRGFLAIYNAMMEAAKELRVGIRYGGDWDMDGNLMEKGETDIGHYELHP